MPLEIANYIAELNPAWPLGTDGVNTSAPHHRNTKRATQQSFPNIDKEVTASADDLNQLTGAATTGSPAGLVPVGTVLQGAWAAAPNGYLACDGAAIDTDYTDLIALVGPNTPNLEGQFVRGTSSDALVDPDGPRAALDQQADDFKSHDHTLKGQQPVQSGSGQSNIMATTGVGFATGVAGGAETRPKNTALLFVIKW